MDQQADPARERSAAERFAILFFAILQVAMTFLPSLGIGEAIGDRSDDARTAITPAGWAFSIWGPLFAGSILYAVYQLAPGQKSNPLLARIGWASAGAFLGNAAWALYTQSIALNFGSALIILFTLACLLHVYRSFALWRPGFTTAERFLVVLPLSALAAWLTAASIVNIAAVLEYHGVDAGGSAPLIAAGVVIVGGLIAAAATWFGRGNLWYALVFLWALAGIYSAGGREQDAIAIAVVIAALFVAAASVLRLTLREDRIHWFGPVAATGTHP